MNVILLNSGLAGEMAGLEKECFAVPWSLRAIQNELQNPIARYFGVLLDGRLAGYGGMQIVLDEGYITNIATRPAFRRRGVAGAVLSRILAEARARSLSFVTLEARVSNLPARALYQKYGFEDVGLRRGYYEKPREDAVMMTLTLKDFDDFHNP